MRNSFQVLSMSTLTTLSDQEQQFLDTFQQAVERDQFDRLILSQYKGELQDLEDPGCHQKLSFR